MKNKVKRYRLLNDLTQQTLAEHVGVTRQTISLIEKGEYNPSLKLCLAICRVLSKTLDDIFWYEEDNINEQK